LKKQVSIDEKLLLEQKLKSLLNVPAPETKKEESSGQGSARSAISGSNASTADADNQAE